MGSEARYSTSFQASVGFFEFTLMPSMRPPMFDVRVTLPLGNGHDTKGRGVPGFAAAYVSSTCLYVLGGIVPMPCFPVTSACRIAGSCASLALRFDVGLCPSVRKDLK